MMPSFLRRFNEPTAELKISMLQNKKIVRTALWVSFLACSPTSAWAKSLEWKFAVGNAYQVKLEQAVEQTTIILLQPVQAKTTIEMEVLWKITAIRPNGDAELSQTLERLSLQVESADAVDVDYDSAREEQTTESATALHQSIAPLLNTPVQVIMRPDGQIVEVKATEESLEKLRGAGGSVKLRAALSPEGLQNMLALISTPLPPDEVEPGDEWTFERKAGAGGQEVSVTHNFKYQGSEPLDGIELDKIGFSTTLTPVPGKATASELKIQSQDSLGSMWFDATAGFPIRCEQTQTLVTTKKIREFTAEVTANSKTICTVTRQP
jgi:hypothetical protein